MPGTGAYSSAPYFTLASSIATCQPEPREHSQPTGKNGEIQVLRRVRNRKSPAQFIFNTEAGAMHSFPFLPGLKAGVFRSN
jgi:hypothetical protein